MLPLLLLPAAWAHADGMLLGIDLHVLDSGTAAVETSFGMLWNPAEASPTWLCHEAVTTPDALITPRYAVSEAGTMLGLVPALEQTREDGLSLYRSTDGCEWSPVSGLDGQTLSQVVFDPTDPDHALVLTANQDEGVSNGIYRSTDGGQSFLPVLEISDRLFRSVHISPGGAAWASAVLYSTGQGWIYTSPDGETWTEHEVPVPEREGTYQDVDLVAVSPADSVTAWVVVGPYYDDILLKTSDGGESFEEVFAVAGDILDAALDEEGGLWLAVSGRDFYYSPDGDDFTEVDEAARGMGVQKGPSEVWLAIEATENGHIAQRTSSDGLESVIHLSTLMEHSCPEDSHTAQYCGPLWPDLAGRLPLPLEEDTAAPPADTAAPDTAKDRNVGTRCGCGSKSSAAVLLPLFFLGLGRRRA